MLILILKLIRFTRIEFFCHQIFPFYGMKYEYLVSYRWYASTRNDERSFVKEIQVISSYVLVTMYPIVGLNHI